MVDDEPESTAPENEAPGQRQTRRSQNGHGAPSTSNGHGSIASWECSVCTYKNIEDEFKCAICETRKGTSTRKPRATSQTQSVQIQALAVELVAKQTNATLRKRRRVVRQQSRSQGTAANTITAARPGRLKNVDRSRGTRHNITVGNVTVVITDYPELKSKSHPPSSSSSLPSSTSTTPTEGLEQK